MEGMQPMLHEYTQIGLLMWPLRNGVIAQTLGPDMFRRYLGDMTKIYGAHRLRAGTSSSSGTATQFPITKGQENDLVLVDVIPSYDGRDQVLSQDLGKAEAKLGLSLEFALPTFFPSPGDAGINVMVAAPGVMEVDGLKGISDMYRLVEFESPIVTFYFFIGELTFKIPFKFHQGYDMDLRGLIDHLIEGFWAEIEGLDASNGSDTVNKLTTYLASLNKSLEGISFLGILPVSAAACIILLRY